MAILPEVSSIISQNLIYHCIVREGGFGLTVIVHVLDNALHLFTLWNKINNACSCHHKYSSA